MNKGNFQSILRPSIYLFLLIIKHKITTDREFIKNLLWLRSSLEFETLNRLLWLWFETWLRFRVTMCMIPSIVQWIFKRKFYKKVGIKKWGQGSVHIRKWYWGHLYLKKWQNGTFSIILPQNWRQLTSNIGFWPKIDIQCTHWHQISIKTTIKTINKWYSGHLYLKNW